MKKIIALLIAAILAMSALSALAAPGDAILGRGEDGSRDSYYNGVFAEGDTLYLTSYDRLLSVYHIGETNTTDYEVRVPESEDGEENVNWDVTVFGCDGQLYAIALKSIYDEHSSFDSAWLCDVTLEGEGEDAAAVVTRKFELDWEDMVEYYDQESYANRPQSLTGFGGKAFMLAYDGSSGEQQVRAMDVETGEMEVADEVGDVYAICRYRDDLLLIETLDYNKGDRVTFYTYDPAAGVVEELAEVPTERYSGFSALAYDDGSDTLYCVKGGEVCPLDLASGEVGAGVADAPLEAYNSCSACVLESGYFAYASSGVCVRNLDPSTRAETRIKVYDGTYSDSVTAATYLFSNAHGDISVAVSHDYTQAQHLVENMMNRDDSVDIYMIDTSAEAYDAVFNRGYMMELDGSEKIAALAESMYPDIRDALSVNGRLCALPVNCYGWSMGVNERALELLGLTIDDVPTNWSDLLDFIDALPDRMSEEKRVTLFYQDETCEGAQRSLFYQMFEEYQNYVNCTDPTIGYDTPLLRGLIEKLEAIDFTRFGYEHESEDEDEEGVSHGGVVVEYGGSVGERIYQLFETGAGCTLGNFYGDMTPILLSMDASTPAYLVLNMSVAFINPFSKHPQEAMLFMEQMVDSMNLGTRYNIDPSLNEPVRGSYYEEWKQQLEDFHEQLLAEYEKADEADKQMLEEQLRDYDESAEEMERYSWDVSPTDLEWYRSHDDNLRVGGVNWIYSETSGGEAAELLSQYLQGQIDARSMLAGIDKKVRMMLMEGH